MEFTKEQLSKAYSAGSPEELKKIAGSEHIDLTDDEAAYYFELLSEAKEAGLSADDLNVPPGDRQVASWIKPKYKVGQKVIWKKGRTLSCFGTVLAVSKNMRLTHEGSREWTYTIDLGNGWVEKYVFEHEISPW